MMAGFGSGGADEGAAGCVPEITGAEDASVEVRVAVTLGADCAAELCRAGPPRAKLTATDAPSTVAVTPAAVSGRHTVRFRPAGREGLAG
jgi:hypothetical protein